MGRSRVIALIAAAAFGSLFAGCLEFDEQTVYVEHDAPNDRLILVLDYKGLYAGDLATDEGGREVAGGEAVLQLREAVKKRTAAFVDNWPFAISVREVREKLADEDKLQLPPELRDGLIRLLQHVEVLNGGFYVDGEDRICGMQVVIVERVSEFIPLANDLINRAILLDAAERSADHVGPMQRAAAEWARAGRPWLSMSGHSISCAVPVPEDVLREGRPEGVGDLLREAGGEEALVLRSICDVLSGPIWALHEDDVLKVKAGYQSRPCTLVTRPRQDDYRGNLVDHIRDTYGLELVPAMATYIADPDAAAETEAERAAKIIAARLPAERRALMLLKQTEVKPAPACYEALRVEALQLGFEAPETELADGELVEFWRARLGMGAAL